jgi:hypothetical protein
MQVGTALQRIQTAKHQLKNLECTLLQHSATNGLSGSPQSLKFAYDFQANQALSMLFDAGMISNP